MSYQAIGTASGQIYAVGKNKSEVFRSLGKKFPSCLPADPHHALQNKSVRQIYPEPLLIMGERLTATDAATIRFLHRPKAGVKANG